MDPGLPNNILARIFKFLYADFLESDDGCIDINKHHCSLLHPCIPISKSATFKQIHTFRLVLSSWNQVFLRTARLDRHPSHVIVEGPSQRNSRIYGLLWKSVVLRRYRRFRDLNIQHGTSLIVFLGFKFFFFFN